MTEDELVCEVKKLEEELKKYKKKLHPEELGKNLGNLRIIKRNKQFYYYNIKEKGDTEGHYIGKENQNLVKQISIRDYEKKVRRIIKNNTAAIKYFLKKFTPDGVDKAFESLHPGKKPFVNPVKMTQTDFIEKWKQNKLESHNFHSDNLKYTTRGGVAVRSKSEVIIGNLLEEYKVPFKYEHPLELNKNGETMLFHPDFVCLNPRTGKEILWEHFGMMDDEEYSNSAVSKILLYEENDFIPGRNFIFTMETSKKPLNVGLVEKLVNQWLV
ncbi:MAG: hypothetical protein MJ188_03980 [Treponema sp.]|nr:hypothetical protein [Treponema sp.]